MTGTNVGSLDPRFVLARARMVIAREVLDAESCPATVGQIALHAHQRRAAARILTLLRAYGGALLADATGLGKTFVALAVADSVERILIIAPASLRDGWRRSAALAGIQASFVSLERLSRGMASPMRDPELVIVDEAHHLRNARTKRYSAVAALCEHRASRFLDPTAPRLALLRFAFLSVRHGSAVYTMTQPVKLKSHGILLRVDSSSWRSLSHLL